MKKVYVFVVDVFDVVCSEFVDFVLMEEDFFFRYGFFLVRLGWGFGFSVWCYFVFVGGVFEVDVGLYGEVV